MSQVRRQGLGEGRGRNGAKSLSHGKKRSAWEELTLWKIKWWWFTCPFGYSILAFSSMKTHEMHSKAMQVFSNFLGGAWSQTPLEACIFTAHHMHPHTHEKAWLHSCGRYTRKENQKDYSSNEPRWQIQPRTTKTSHGNSEDREMQSLLVTAKHMWLRDNTNLMQTIESRHTIVEISTN